MAIKISGGIEEEGIVVGNNYDKYGSSNPIVKKIMQGFEDSLSALVAQANPKSIHEIGCGEGYWSLDLAGGNYDVRASDFSEEVIKIARQNASDRGVDPEIFSQKSIYDLKPGIDNADLIVCCEVMEHIEDPEAGLAALHSITDKHLILSVPREPIWRALNMARGQYLTDLGNTPGHIQHWSTSGFKKFVSSRFHIKEIRTPLPWTMLLCEPKPTT